MRNAKDPKSSAEQRDNDAVKAKPAVEQTDEQHIELSLDRIRRDQEDARVAANTRKKPMQKPKQPHKSNDLKPLDIAQDHQLTAQRERAKAQSAPPIAVTAKIASGTKQAQTKAPGFQPGPTAGASTQATAKDQVRAQKTVAAAQQPPVPPVPPAQVQVRALHR